MPESKEYAIISTSETSSTSHVIERKTPSKWNELATTNTTSAKNLFKKPKHRPTHSFSTENSVDGFFANRTKDIRECGLPYHPDSIPPCGIITVEPPILKDPPRGPMQITSLQRTQFKVPNVHLLIKL